MPIVKIILEESERDALQMLARGEKRDPRAQAALLIRAQLEYLGLLSRAPIPANGTPAQGEENTNAKNN